MIKDITVGVIVGLGVYFITIELICYLTGGNKNILCKD